MNVGLEYKKNNLGGLHVINCKKCNTKCFPIYEVSPLYSLCYICRGCALLILEKNNDRRLNEIKKTDWYYDRNI